MFVPSGSTETENKFLEREKGPKQVDRSPAEQVPVDSAVLTEVGDESGRHLTRQSTIDQQNDM